MPAPLTFPWSTDLDNLSKKEKSFLAISSTGYNLLSRSWAAGPVVGCEIQSDLQQL